MDGRSRLVGLRRLGILAVLVGGAAVLLADFGDSSLREAEPPRPPELVVTSVPSVPTTRLVPATSTAAPPVSGATVGDLVPPLRGRALVALVGQSVFSLADWSGGETEPALQALEGLWVGSVQFDPAGALLGYLAGASLLPFWRR